MRRDKVAFLHTHAAIGETPNFGASLFLGAITKKARGANAGPSSFLDP